MNSLSSLLAETSEQTIRQLTEQINAIHTRIATQPEWAFNLLWMLAIITTVVVIVIFHRQKRIAQNQVDLGRLIAQLIEQEK